LQNARRKKLIVGYKSWILPAMNGCSSNQQPGKELHMKLYYAPGACSMAPHIVAREAGHTFDLERVDIPNKKTADGGDYWKINPKGYVPALMLDDGQVLTEVAVICQYLGDQKPQAGLVPQSGTMERYRLMEALNFASSEVHKQIGALFNPNLTAEMKEVQLGVIGRRLDALEKLLDGTPICSRCSTGPISTRSISQNGRTSRHTWLESVQGRRCRKPCGRKVCWDSTRILRVRPDGRGSHSTALFADEREAVGCDVTSTPGAAVSSVFQTRTASGVGRPASAAGPKRGQRLASSSCAMTARAALLNRSNSSVNWMRWGAICLSRIVDAMRRKFLPRSSWSGPSGTARLLVTRTSSSWMISRSVCWVRPCQAKGASAPHYSSWRISKECAEDVLR
jgi:glutathione S-transferase